MGKSAKEAIDSLPGSMAFLVFVVCKIQKISIIFIRRIKHPLPINQPEDYSMTTSATSYRPNTTIGEGGKNDK